MIAPGRETPPRFRGVSTYQDPRGLFSFRYPSTWNTFELADGAEGALFSPEYSQPQTYLAAWVSRLPEPVVAEDLDLLGSGMAEGLARLNSCEVIESHDDAVGNLVRLERLHTFSDDGVVRQRRVRVMYADTWQIAIVYQGESRQEYEYWSPMGNYSFATLELTHDL